ncbi:MAG: N-acetylneuraminate lyase [Clostridia bacterium]|nr:N-acetylneuraminate lyase [Clostridia bacterium]
MSKLNIKGMIPAFVTPFKADGSLNLEAAKAHAKRLIEKGADGLYVGGSSGEMILLSNDERKLLLETLMETVPAGFPIIAHIGAANPADAYDLALHAEKLGVAAISSVTPFYYKYSFAEIKKYYETISKLVKTPMIIYNIPMLSGSSLNMAQLFELLSIEGVAGMKFTCSDYYMFERTRKAFPDKLLYNGSDEMVLAGLAMGADGGIGTNYNTMIDKFAKIYKLFNENKMAEALAVQNEVNDVVEEMFKYNLLPGVKYLVAATGCDCGKCRDPFVDLTDDEKTALKNAVRGKLSWDIVD